MSRPTEAASPLVVAKCLGFRSNARAFDHSVSQLVDGLFLLSPQQAPLFAYLVAAFPDREASPGQE
jgi:hypothetical protein